MAIRCHYHQQTFSDLPTFALPFSAFHLILFNVLPLPWVLVGSPPHPPTPPLYLQGSIRSSSSSDVPDSCLSSSTLPEHWGRQYITVCHASSLSYEAVPSHCQIIRQMTVFWTPCRNSVEATASHKSVTQLISCLPQSSSSCSRWVTGEVIWCSEQQLLAADPRSFTEPEPRAGPQQPRGSSVRVTGHWDLHQMTWEPLSNTDTSTKPTYVCDE